MSCRRLSKLCFIQLAHALHDADERLFASPQCKDAVTGVYIDQVTLSKGASWRPNPVAAKAYYDTITPADPLPGAPSHGQFKCQFGLSTHYALVQALV
jgi:hypothetical protein